MAATNIDTPAPLSSPPPQANSPTLRDPGYDAGETFGRHFVERITKARSEW
ncbi:hypothetical protein [Nocardia amamiensis]|uniref:hypothetical protein n=1 Tax=Nocardia TaxID=1817 RepID=UPI0033C377D4